MHVRPGRAPAAVRALTGVSPGVPRSETHKEGITYTREGAGAREYVHWSDSDWPCDDRPRGARDSSPSARSLRRAANRTASRARAPTGGDAIATPTATQGRASPSPAPRCGSWV